MQSLLNIIFPKKFKILVVCTANVCRSPMAHAILRDIVKKRGLKHKVQIESAGTHVPTTGLMPDQRAIKVLKEHKINSQQLKTRQLVSNDAATFDMILVMDKKNMTEAKKILSPTCEQLEFVMQYVPNAPTIEVIDPYYGPNSGFQSLYTMLHTACAGVLFEYEKRL